MLPVFEFIHGDNYFLIHPEGKVEVQPVAPSLKGSNLIVNRIPQYVAERIQKVKAYRNDF